MKTELGRGDILGRCQYKRDGRGEFKFKGKEFFYRKLTLRPSSHTADSFCRWKNGRSLNCLHQRLSFQQGGVGDN